MSLPPYLIGKPLNPGEITGLVEDQIIKMNESKFERVALHSFTFFCRSLCEESLQLEVQANYMPPVRVALCLVEFGMTRLIRYRVRNY